MSLLILDQSGHQATTLDLSTAEAITEAETLIHAHQAKGGAVFADGEMMTKGARLSPTTRETIVTMPLQGG